MRLTVLIATLDEQLNLPSCLDAVGELADEIVVIDSASTDRTVAIAEEYGAVVHQFPGVEETGQLKRNWALDHLELSGDWILVLDADEVLTTEIKSQIRSVIDSPDDRVGFYLRYSIHFMGRQIRHAGMKNAMQLRLFKQGEGRYETLPFRHDSATGDVEIHEKIVCNGKVGVLDGMVLHDDYRGLTNWIAKHNRYSTWEAHRRLAGIDHLNLIDTCRLLASRDVVNWRIGARSLATRLPCRPVLFFLWSYVFAGGWRDGREGLAFCASLASYHMQSDFKYRELVSRPGSLKPGSDR